MLIPNSQTLPAIVFEEVLGKNPKIFKSGKTDPAIYHTLWKKYSVVNNVADVSEQKEIR